jgi:hypothetical protein
VSSRLEDAVPAGARAGSPPRAGTPDTRAVRAGALRLRAWAFRVLWGDGGAAPEVESPGAWPLFLGVERCALPLLRRLEAGDGGEGLPARAGAQLRARAMVEVKRALSAGAELRRVSTVLEAHGWRALVLKGGAHLAAGTPPLDVWDVDLLLAPGQALPLGRALSATGAYATVGEDAPPGTPGRWEAATRISPGGVQVELHFAIPYLGAGVDPWAGAVPAGVPGVLRMSPPLHLWHVLVHGVSHHPDRRGALRDLLLLAAAHGECAPAQVEEVRARAARHPHRALLLRALALVEEAAAGRIPRDPFRAEAALRYGLAADPPRGPLWRTRIVPEVACAAVAGGAELARDVLGGVGEGRLSPGPAGAAWAVMRTANRVLALPGALRRARAARALAAAVPES